MSRHDGTVTVNGTVWLKNGGCFSDRDWNAAASAIKSLASGQCGLKDKSQAGDWRLPTIDELKSINSNSSVTMPVDNYWSSTMGLNHKYYCAINSRNGITRCDYHISYTF